VLRGIAAATLVNPDLPLPERIRLGQELTLPNDRRRDPRSVLGNDSAWLDSTLPIAIDGVRAELGTVPGPAEAQEDQADDLPPADPEESLAEQVRRLAERVANAEATANWAADQVEDMRPAQEAGDPGAEPDAM
jgi:hypothetical protein